jgi:hypothetical protein
MHQDTAQAIAFSAISYIIGEDHLRDRFMALTGLDTSSLRARLVEPDFQASILEFLLGHEPDLISFAEHITEKPENVVHAWRALGGGEGQEW